MLIAGRKAESATFGLVLLHGRGAGAADILELGEALALPDLALVAPEAPGRSWWPSSFLAPHSQMEPYVQAGLAQVDNALAFFREAGLPLSRIGLLGFSQGSCLAAEYLARKGEGVGFGLILSGGLVGQADAATGPDAELFGYQDKELEYSTRLSGTQIYMSCHANDPHIPYKRFAESISTFRRLDASVADRTKPGPGHGMDQTDVTEIRRRLNVVAAT